jgi:protein PhnA
MTMEQSLQERSNSQCELCSSSENLAVYEVPPGSNNSPDGSAYICQTCRTQIEDAGTTDPNHWRCLNDSMWSQIPAVQVIAWRMLTRLSGEGWPQDLLEMLYLEEETLAWARTMDGADDVDMAIKHFDSNGAVLTTGDTVTLIKDLVVKGANFTAKRGTSVRGISLVSDNPEHIEGRVSGQRIVILTKFVKKSG